MEELCERLALALFSRRQLSGQLAKLGSPLLQLLIGGVQVGGPLPDLAFEGFIQPVECLLGAFLFGEIDGRNADADDVPGGIPYRLIVAVKEYALAVAGQPMRVTDHFAGLEHPASWLRGSKAGLRGQTGPRPSCRRPLRAAASGYCTPTGTPDCCPASPPAPASSSSARRKRCSLSRSASSALLALGDIRIGPAQEQRSAIGIALDNISACQNPQPHPVLGFHPELG